METNFALVFATVAGITIGSAAAAFCMAFYLDPLTTTQDRVLECFKQVWLLGVGTIIGLLTAGGF